METFQDLPVIYFASQTEWQDWLSTHHADSNGIWLKQAKKNSGVPSVNRTEALDVALCYGWIDGMAKSVDETYYLQKYTPRRPKSLWSQVNIGKVEALIAAGKMQPAGMAAIEAAKADGRWDAAYHPPSSATVPPELEAALAKNPKAKAFFDTLNKTNRYAVIWRIATAKKPETKLARAEKIVAMLEAGETFH